MPENIKIPLLLIAGVTATAYGMLRENHFVFIIGIVMVVAGYRVIRKNLKRSIDPDEEPENPFPPDEE